MRKLLALGTIGAVLAAAVIWRSRLAADFWPLDASRVGPNLVASLIQAALVFIAAVLVWPPARRRLERYVKTHADAVHEKLDRLHAQRAKLGPSVLPA